jgi:hypothetical protein
MAHVEDDDVFSRFVEDRREFGFQGKRPQQRRPMGWPWVALITVVLGAGLITLT